MGPDFFGSNFDDKIQSDGAGNISFTPPDGSNVDWAAGTVTIPGEGLDTSMGLPPEVTQNADGSFTIEILPDATQGADGSIVFPDNAPPEGDMAPPPEGDMGAPPGDATAPPT